MYKYIAFSADNDFAFEAIDNGIYMGVYSAQTDTQRGHETIGTIPVTVRSLSAFLSALF